MKNREEHKIIFNPGGCLSEYALECLVKGTLSHQEQQMIMDHAQQCELCSDAISGAKYFASADEYSQAVLRMKNSAYRKSLNTSNNSRKLYYTISAVAASILLFFGIFYVIESGDELNRKNLLPEKQVISAIDENKLKPAPETIEKIDDNITEDEISIKKSDRKEKQAPKVIQNLHYIAPIVADTLNVYSTEMQYMEEETNEIALTDYNTDDYIQEPLAASETKSAETGGFAAESPKKAEAKSETNRIVVNYDKAIELSSATGNLLFTEPVFRGGGIEYFKKYVEDSLKTFVPESISNQVILVNFSIDDSGKIKNVKLLQSTNIREFDKKIIAIIENSPTWTPALQNNSPIVVDKQIEIRLGKN